MAIDSRYKMSQERLDTLKEELHYLETTREKEVAELIKEARSFRVMMVNDRYDAERGELRLTLEAQDGREVARATRPFDIAPLGTLTHDLELVVPGEPGRYLLKATAVGGSGSRTVSRRKVTIGGR